MYIVQTAYLLITLPNRPGSVRAAIYTYIEERRKNLSKKLSSMLSKPTSVQLPYVLTQASVLHAAAIEAQAPPSSESLDARARWLIIWRLPGHGNESNVE